MKKLVLTGISQQVSLNSSLTVNNFLVFNEGELHIEVTSEVADRVANFVGQMAQSSGDDEPEDDYPPLQNTFESLEEEEESPLSFGMEEDDEDEEGIPQG